MRWVRSETTSKSGRQPPGWAMGEREAERERERERKRGERGENGNTRKWKGGRKRKINNIGKPKPRRSP